MILDEIAASTRIRVENRKKEIPLEQVQEQAVTLAGKEGHKNIRNGYADNI